MMKNKKFTIVLMALIFAVVLYIAGCSIGDFGVQSSPSIKTEDEAEEDAQNLDSKLTELKDTIVSPPVIISHTSGEEIFGSSDKELIFIKGTADPGNTIEVYVNGLLQQKDIIVDNRENFETLNGIELIEGKNIIELVSISPSGNESNPTKFNIFLIVPQKSRIYIIQRFWRFGRNR